MGRAGPAPRATHTRNRTQIHESNTTRRVTNGDRPPGPNRAPPREPRLRTPILEEFPTELLYIARVRLWEFLYNNLTVQRELPRAIARASESYRELSRAYVGVTSLNLPKPIGTYLASRFGLSLRRLARAPQPPTDPSTMSTPARRRDVIVEYQKSGTRSRYSNNGSHMDLSRIVRRCVRWTRRWALNCTLGSWPVYAAQTLVVKS